MYYKALLFKRPYLGVQGALVGFSVTRERLAIELPLGRHRCNVACWHDTEVGSLKRKHAKFRTPNKKKIIIIKKATNNKSIQRHLSVEA